MISKELKSKKRPVDVISEEERKRIKDEARRKREELNRQIEEQKRKNREKRASREIRTMNGRQLGLTTSAGMDQATRSAKDYKSWLKRETGQDLTTEQSNQIDKAFSSQKTNQGLNSLYDRWKENNRNRQIEMVEEDKQAGGRLNDLAAAEERSRRYNKNYNDNLMDMYRQYQRQQQQNMVEEDKRAGGRFSEYIEGLKEKNTQEQTGKTGPYQEADKIREKYLKRLQQEQEGKSKEEIYDDKRSQLMGEKDDFWTRALKGGDIAGRDTAEDFRQITNIINKNKKNGNIYTMSDEDLEGFRTGMRNRELEKAKEAQKAAQDYSSRQPGQAWADVFDLIENEDQATLAEDQKSEWQKTQGQRRQSSVDQADNYFRFEYDPNMFEGDEPEAIRAMVYDRIMEGKDTYEDRTAGMSQEQKAELDARIDRAIGLANDTEHYGVIP
ncbi:MAG: hypothetical protein J6Y48_17605, partial [Clostridia bacterium]|nr:hypothetical protein [Clostridia bacterium]